MAEINADLIDVVNYRQPSLTYRVSENTASGKITKLDAIKQSVEHILKTERYSNPIYGDNYGVELDQYIGADFATITAGIEWTLKDALTQDDRITDVIVTNIEKLDHNSCLIEFDVETIYGTIKEELNV